MFILLVLTNSFSGPHSKVKKHNASRPKQQLSEPMLRVTSIEDIHAKLWRPRTAAATVDIRSK
jgi:hypothetical protein